MLLSKSFNNETSCSEETKQAADESTCEVLDLTLENYSPTRSELQSNDSSSFPIRVIEIQRAFNSELNNFNFLKPPVRYIYNPTEYASEPFELYIHKFCQNPKELLFVGMKPSPYEMCQTGIPYGDANSVKNWLGIEGNVSKPSDECPARPIYGFSYNPKEKGNDTFWKFWSDLCGPPENFFCNAYVYMYCPLVFMDAKGRNMPPSELQFQDRKELESICDKYYLELVYVIQPRVVIAIGDYIKKRIVSIFKNSNISLPVIYLPCPNYRTVKINWVEEATHFLEINQLFKQFQ